MSDRDDQPRRYVVVLEQDPILPGKVNSDVQFPATISPQRLSADMVCIAATMLGNLKRRVSPEAYRKCMHQILEFDTEDLG